MVLLALCLLAQNPLRAPVYDPSSIVNAASNRPGPLAPHTIVSIYGQTLAWTTRAIRAEDLKGSLIPTVLPGSGVRVIVGGLLAGIYYASPDQVNFLVPNDLVPGRHSLEVVRDGVAGPRVTITLAAESPELFVFSERTAGANVWAVATHADGVPITPDRPAAAGEVIVLYATGLGRTRPDSLSGQIATGAAPLARTADFRVWLAGKAIDSFAYVGLTPGFGGLYQINLTVPASVPADPEIQIGFLDRPLSQPGVRLPLRMSTPPSPE